MKTLALLCALGCSCSTLSPETQTLTVEVAPDAEVFLDGELVGRGTIQVDVARGAEIHRIDARLGETSGTCWTSRGLSTTGVLDAFGLCVAGVPGIGLLFDGAYRHRPEVIRPVLR